VDDSNPQYGVSCAEEAAPSGFVLTYLCWIILSYTAGVGGGSRVEDSSPEYDVSSTEEAASSFALTYCGVVSKTAAGAGGSSGECAVSTAGSDSAFAGDPDAFSISE